MEFTKFTKLTTKSKIIRDIQSLFEIILRGNLLTIWIVIPITIIFALFILYFFTIYFVVRAISKPFQWIYKQLFN